MTCTTFLLVHPSSAFGVMIMWLPCHCHVTSTLWWCHPETWDPSFYTPSYVWGGMLCLSVWRCSIYQSLGVSVSGRGWDVWDSWYSLVVQRGQFWLHKVPQHLTLANIVQFDTVLNRCQAGVLWWLYVIKQNIDSPCVLGSLSLWVFETVLVTVITEIWGNVWCWL